MNFSKFVGEASSALSRAVQFTEEKLGTAEKTEYDAHFDNLITRADQYEVAIQKILNAVEIYLQPNPAYRAEDFVASKIEQFKRARPTPSHQLGEAFQNVGHEMSTGNLYGNVLVQCGQTQSVLGTLEQEMLEKIVESFVKPLEMFLENDIKTLHKERRTMEARRLDLDACKARLRKATNDAQRIPIEAELRVAQSLFNTQVEKTKLLLDNVNNAQVSHQHCLTELVEAQAKYFELAHEELQKLQRQIMNG